MKKFFMEYGVFFFYGFVQPWAIGEWEYWLGLVGVVSLTILRDRSIEKARATDADLQLLRCVKNGGIAQGTMLYNPHFHTITEKEYRP